MNAQGLAQLVHTPDVDYVQRFQALATAHLEIETRGPTVARLLRRGILEMQVGDYQDARRTMDAALRLDSGVAEIHYQRGCAYALLACVKAEAVPPGPGHHEPSESIRFLLTEAATAFKESIALNDEDTEAQERLLRIGSVLDTGDSEESLAALLRGEDEGAPQATPPA